MGVERFINIGKFFEGIFKPIVDPIKGIGNVFIMIGKGILALKKIIFWIFNLIKWIFVDFLSPTNLTRDFLKSITAISKLIVISILDIITTLVRYSFNSLTSPLSESVLGVDDDADAKCYKHNDSDKIPITIIISTILLPPLGVFMEFGLSYWINIIICAMLTYFYYVPGLVYALIIIYK